eukprot:jgi/Ulvmu1/1280/UM011_0004.1
MSCVPADGDDFVPECSSWTHPDTGAKARVQMVMGATLLRRSGEQPAVKLMRSVKPGCIIDCVGRPAPLISGAEPGALKFTAVSVTVVLPGAVSARGGSMPLQTLIDLSNPLVGGEAAAGRVLPQAGGKGFASALPRQVRAAGKGKASFEVYKCPLAAEDIVLVDTAEGVRRVHEELMAAARAVSRRSMYHDAVLVGLDAEWEPHGRGEAATPVATLQIATRSRAWVLDMQALCRSVRKNRRDRPGGSPEIPGSGEQRLPWPSTHAHLAQLTAEERATSDFLAALFAEPALLKLGFAFHNDLHGLINSFPHLPVFAALPVRIRTPRRVPPPPPPVPRQRQRLRRAAPARGDHTTAPGCSGGATGEGRRSGGAQRDTAAGGKVGGADRRTSATEAGRLQGGQGVVARGATGACEGPPGFQVCSFINMSALEAICRQRQTARKQESLNALTKRLLGKVIDKTEQVSMWSERPLRPRQLEYAANDAHVLVVVADQLAAAAAAPPTLGTLWDAHSGRHLLQTMYPKLGAVDEGMFVFSAAGAGGEGGGGEEGAARAAWRAWREDMWARRPR